MRPMKHITLALLGCLALASCTTRSRTVKTLGIYGPGVLQNPVVADLDVRAEKVTGTATGNSRGVAALQDDAIADALAKAQADVLVEPMFQTVNNGGRTTVTATGFPATYTNMRAATTVDKPMLEIGALHAATASDPFDQEKQQHKAKGRGWWLAGGVLLLILLL